MNIYLPYLTPSAAVTVPSITLSTLSKEVAKTQLEAVACGQVVGHTVDIGDG